MSVCLIITGYIYQYLISIDNIIQNIVIPNNADIYLNIGIFNNIRGRDNNNNVRHRKDLNNEDILIIKKKLGDNLKKIFIFDIDDNYKLEMEKSNKRYKKRTDDFDPGKYNAAYCSSKGNCIDGPTNQQYFHLKKCIEMIPKNKKYDYCVRIRLDTRLNEIFNLDTIKLTSIKKSDTQIIKNDFYDLEHFFCGKFEDMKYILTNFSEKIGSYRKKCYINNTDFTLCPETQFSQFLYENNYQYINAFNHVIKYIDTDIYNDLNIKKAFSYHIYLKNEYKLFTKINNNINKFLYHKEVINFDINKENNILCCWYGTKDKHIYITNLLETLLSNNSINININNNTFNNDPSEHNIKKLCIIYLLYNKNLNVYNIRKIYFKENDIISNKYLKYYEI